MSSVERAGLPSHVVGIGAGAGGIAAIEQVLAPLSGVSLAVVVVMQPTRDQDRRLRTGVGLMSPLPVAVAREGQRLEPGQVYVAPERWDVRIRADVLWLCTPTQPRSAIDRCFASLAQEWGGSAVGVVLSGAGADGTAGLAAIRQAGGRTYVQEPSSAGFAAMPASATSHAQLRLPPGAIGDALRALGATSPHAR